MSKILMFCPTYKVDGKIQAYQASLDSIHAIVPPEGVQVDFILGLDNPYGVEGRHKNTLHQYQQARRKMLADGYDALFTVEHDMLIPPDALTKLWETKAAVVYGLYMLRHGAYVVNCMRYVPDSPSIDSSLTLFPEQYRQAERRGYIRCSGVGMGCTLIRRNVLERFELRAATEESYAPDWRLATDCQRTQLIQICRFDVKCGHIDGGIAIYPNGAEIMTGIKVRILQDFVGHVNGRSVPLRKGQETEIDINAAREYSRAGLLTILNDMPAAAKIIHKRAGKAKVK